MAQARTLWRLRCLAVVVIVLSESLGHGTEPENHWCGKARGATIFGCDAFGEGSALCAALKNSTKGCLGETPSSVKTSLKRQKPSRLNRAPLVGGSTVGSRKLLGRSRRMRRIKREVITNKKPGPGRVDMCKDQDSTNDRLFKFGYHNSFHMIAMKEALGYADDWSRRWAKMIKTKTLRKMFYKPWQGSQNWHRSLPPGQKWTAHTLTVDYSEPKPCAGKTVTHATAHGRFAGSGICEMQMRVSGAACPSAQYNDYFLRKFCSKCENGYVSTSVITRQSERHNDYRCDVWFVYADTLFRNSFNLVRTNWLTDRVAACSKFRTCGTCVCPKPSHPVRRRRSNQHDVQPGCA